MAEQWIDWHPQVGDIKPERYRHKRKDSDAVWLPGREPGKPIDELDCQLLFYQIPAPAVKSAEDRPPWIDPKCKFRWGDRVKDNKGNIWFVNHPHDGDSMFPVVCTRTPHYAAPYTAGDVPCWHQDDNIDVFNEEDLELFPEDLPQHFDDRILDADQPQEQPEPARVPREIWVNKYPNRWGQVHESYADAYENQGRDSIYIVHFREVL